MWGPKVQWYVFNAPDIKSVLWTVEMMFSYSLSFKDTRASTPIYESMSTAGDFAFSRNLRAGISRRIELFLDRTETDKSCVLYRILMLVVANRISLARMAGPWRVFASPRTCQPNVTSRRGVARVHPFWRIKNFDGRMMTTTHVVASGGTVPGPTTAVLTKEHPYGWGSSVKCVFGVSTY